MVTQTVKKFVAIVDDDESIRAALQGFMKEAGLPAQAFASAEEFLGHGDFSQVGCLVADIRMPGMSGLELQARLNAERHRIPTVFITAHGDASMKMQALRAGAVEFLAKPSMRKSCSIACERQWRTRRVRRQLVGRSW